MVLTVLLHVLAIEPILICVNQKLENVHVKMVGRGKLAKEVC